MGGFLCIRRQNFSRQKGVFQHAEKGWKYLQTQGWTLGRTLHSRKKKQPCRLWICLWSNVPWGEGKTAICRAKSDTNEWNSCPWTIHAAYGGRQVVLSYETAGQRINIPEVSKHMDVVYRTGARKYAGFSAEKSAHWIVLHGAAHFRRHQKERSFCRNSHCCCFSSQKYAAFSRQIGYFCLLWFAGSYRAAGTDGYPCVHTQRASSFMPVSPVEFFA